MYSSEYEEEKYNSSNGNFYQNNKTLIWIFISIVLVVIAIFILKNNIGSSSGSDNNSANNISVMIYPESDIVIAPGNTYKLIAVVDNNPNAVITWVSSDTNVATVLDGVVTAIDYGKAIITASYIHSDSKKYDVLKEITVADGKSDISVTDVSIQDGDLVMFLGGTYSIGLNIVPSNAYVSGKDFKSSNESVVTVDSKGNVKAVGYGEATITVDINNGAFIKELKVFVSEKCTSSKIIVNPTTITLDKESTKIKAGETVKLSYIVIPDEAKNSYLVWSSSDENVLTVDKSGIITAIKEGSATIKLSSLNGISGSLDIEVIPSIVDVTGINLSLNDIYLEVGQSQIITPIVTPDTATDKTLVYSVSDPSIITVETMNEGTSCSITGIKEGSAILTIKSNTGNAIKTVNVTVGATTETNNSGSCASCSKVTCTSGKYCSCGKCYNCPAGYTCSNNTRTKCSQGFYCPGNGVIYRCPSGKTTKGTGAKDANACSLDICKDGTYGSPGSCTTCPKGSYCYGGNKYDCPSGKTTSGTGATGSGACQYSASGTCERGQYISNNKCFSCSKGYWCDGQIEHKCPNGTTTKGTGSKYESACTVANTTTCNPGYYLSGSSCVICPENSVCFSNNKYACPSGKVTNGKGKSSYSDCK